MEQHRFGNRAADGHARIKAGKGILEDHLDALATAAHLVFLQAGNLLAFQLHRARYRRHQL
jgi:hypothetical protein